MANIPPNIIHLRTIHFLNFDGALAVMTVLRLHLHCRHPLVHSGLKRWHWCFLVGVEVHQALLSAAREPPAAWAIAAVGGNLS